MKVRNDSNLFVDFKIGFGAILTDDVVTLLWLEQMSSDATIRFDLRRFVFSRVLPLAVFLLELPLNEVLFIASKSCFVARFIKCRLNVLVALGHRLRAGSLPLALCGYVLSRF